MTTPPCIQISLPPCKDQEVTGVAVLVHDATVLDGVTVLVDSVLQTVEVAAAVVVEFKEGLATAQIGWQGYDGL